MEELNKLEYFFRGIGGGLGDFLCNYASMKTLALDNNRDFYLYGWTKFLEHNQGTNPYINRCLPKEAYILRSPDGWAELFKEREKFVETIRPEHKNYLMIQLPFEPIKNISFDDGPIHIDGFPFSNAWFEHRIQDIKNCINIPNNITFNFEKNDVVLNTRRGEYIGASPEFIDLCFTDYYLKALQNLNPKRIILVSDDLIWTKEWFNQTLKKYFPNVELMIYQEKPILQFEFMIKAPNLIICQSQFSRWSGIFNENNVFSPHKWYKTLDKHERSYNLKHWNIIKYMYN
jgi:hypothetical protein